MTDRDELIAKVVEAEEQASISENGRPQILLSSGVILNLTSVPKTFIYEATRAFKRPKIPTYLNEEKGREEENPGDPDYLEALEMYAADVANAATDVALLRGTSIQEIPDDVIGPDSEEWIQEMEVLGLPMRDNPRARYMTWIKAIAAPLDKDINGLLEEVGRLTGVSESDVADAVDRFRRNTARSKDRRASS